MSNLEKPSIEYYQELLSKDPHSQAFAALAEALRTAHKLTEAETVARNGLARHPNFSTGHLVLGKILKDKGELQSALQSLRTAAQMNPENLMAHQILGEVCIDLKIAKEALKAFKMVLFLNPRSDKAKQIVRKLESSTADEYEDEVFEMSQLQKLDKERLQLIPNSADSRAKESAQSIQSKKNNFVKTAKGLERMLSLIDAFIVRNDINKAHNLLRESQSEFGDHPELNQRLKILQLKSSPHSLENISTAEPPADTEFGFASEASRHQSLKDPNESRAKLVRRKKLDLLYSLLRKIELQPEFSR